MTGEFQEYPNCGACKEPAEYALLECGSCGFQRHPDFLD